MSNIVAYLKETLLKNGSKVECNRLSDLLMVFAPWATVFDGAAAWSVNHLSLVPPPVDSGLHLPFSTMGTFCCF